MTGVQTCALPIYKIGVCSYPYFATQSQDGYEHFNTVLRFLLFCFLVYSLIYFVHFIQCIISDICAHLLHFILSLYRCGVSLYQFFFVRQCLTKCWIYHNIELCSSHIIFKCLKHRSFWQKTSCSWHSSQSASFTI